MASDLIYCGHEKEDADSIRSDLEEAFPECKIVSEWDEVHGMRFEITIDIEPGEFYITLLTLGLLHNSLKLGLIQHTDEERFNNLMSKALERMKGGT